MLSQLAHAHLASVQPYSPGKPVEELARELGITGAVKLASNESPFGASPASLAAMRAAAAQAHRYPDTMAHALRARLAEQLEVAPDELAFGNGSNVLIDQLAHIFTGPGRHAVIGSPSFVCYALSLSLTHADVTAVPLDEGLFWNVDRLLEAVTPQTRLLFVDNPNNPTSTHLPGAELERLLSQLPHHVVPVIDEAYLQFADASDYRSALGMRTLHPNLVILRTFSKAYGLAAARVGYAIAPAELCAYIERVRPAFNVDAIAQAGALAALDDGAHLQRYLEHNRLERARLMQALRARGLRVAPSQANFITLTLDREAASVYQAMLQQGVIVRAFAALPATLRITVGTREENDRMLTALEQALR